MFAFFTVMCKKEIADRSELKDIALENSEIDQRNGGEDVHTYYIDGVVAQQATYQANLTGTGVYEHIIIEPTQTQVMHEHFAFSTKSAYTYWGDSRGFKTTRAIRLSEQLAFIADSAGLNQVSETSMDTIPQWYEDIKENLLQKELGDNDSPDFLCYIVYFWQGYAQANIPAHVKAGGNMVSDPRILWNNNKFSSWKPDVMTCLFGYKHGHLIAWDKWHYKRPIPNPNAPYPTTITVKGNIFTPFLNIYAAWDDKISSYTSWETVKH